MAFDFIDEALHKRQQQGLYRSSVTTQGKQGRYLTVATKAYLNFSSNDYLGLASDPELIKAWHKGAELYGIGSGGSFLVTGYNQAHEDLCEQLKSWLGVSSVALFSSGYSANQAIIKLLLQKNDLLLQDKLNHASLIEAGALSESKMLRFRHNQVEHLATLLNRNTSSTANKLIISEGVFSMDGDKSPIHELNKVAKNNNAWFMVDDAHGLGVLGDKGKGSVVASGLNNSDVNIYMATFGKALGVSGAFVAGNDALVKYLTNFSKPYIYSTGLPPAMAYTIAHAATMVEKQDWRRDKLNSLVTLFKQTAASHGIELTSSDTSIQPIIIGDNLKTLKIADSLKTMGYWTTAIRPPTVAVNSARLRITITANHEKQDITNLVKTLAKVINE